ncbi:MAG: hypothetical protein P8J33_17565 [Pirellulaceae bacterium]|nr:hypothetical protein [Pirellulaceae bacterium]
MELNQGVKRSVLYWRWKAKRLFPNRVFATVIGLASGLVTFLCFGVAINIPVWPMAIPGFLFFCVCLLASTAAITPKGAEREAREHFLREPQQDKSTIAIFVLLLGVMTSILVISMHIFRAVFPNGPGSLKYFITLGIAIGCSIFMKRHGNQLVKRHFGKTGGRDLVLSGKQAVAVIFFMVGVGVYIAWLLAE